MTGQRADRTAPVAINGHEVPVSGGRKWRARLSVETVRAWSAPLARKITIQVAGVETKAALPIGLLGHAPDLAYLTVTAK